MAHRGESEQHVNPPGEETVFDFLLTQFYVCDCAASYRGWKRGTETYVNPFAALDPGEPEVAGRIADGFNLDGKIGANNFVNLNGEKADATDSNELRLA